MTRHRQNGKMIRGFKNHISFILYNQWGELTDMFFCAFAFLSKIEV